MYLIYIYKKKGFRQILHRSYDTIRIERNSLSIAFEFITIIHSKIFIPNNSLKRHSQHLVTIFFFFLILFQIQQTTAACTDEKSTISF